VGEIEEVSAAYAGVVRGRVRLGMVRGCSIPPFLDAVADYRRDHPGVELALAEDDSELLQRRVLSGDLDLALVGWAGEVLDGLVATVVVDEPVAAVVPVDHRLADRAEVTWRELDGEPLLGLVRGTGVRAAVDASAPGRDVDLEASSPETLLGLARRGAGVALLSPSMATGAEGVRALVVADAPVRARLGLVARRGRRPAATERLLAALRATLLPPPQAGSGAQQRP
jgi:DNA-binding transcriptional LysR family regulator